jgi:hypothetical protein
MRRFILAMLALLGPLVHAADITSADLKQCPDGHTTLKDVPIRYGLPAASTKAEWKEIDRQIENLEFILGGCEISEDSPKVRPTCRTCRFAYDSQSNTWSRRSSDVHTFRRPFTELLMSFPLPANPRKLEYEQGVQSDRVVLEAVVFTASKDQPELKSRIDEWFAAHKIRASYSEPYYWPGILREWKASGISIRFSWDGTDELFVWLTHYIDPKKT